MRLGCKKSDLSRRPKGDKDMIVVIRVPPVS
jgi:hypothetical protein